MNRKLNLLEIQIRKFKRWEAADELNAWDVQSIITTALVIAFFSIFFITGVLIIDAILPFPTH